MSEQRAASAVRNLRSMFENKSTLDNPDSSPARGRSPGAFNSDKENGEGRPTSKVRASFVPVAPVKMATTMGDSAPNGVPAAEKEQQRHEQGQNELSSEAVMNVLGTPPRKAKEVAPKEESPLAQKGDQPPVNPDKPVSAVEEEPGAMKTADLADEQCVSGGAALPPVAEDIRSSTRAMQSSAEKKPTTNGKPPAISTKPSSKPSSSALKSPATQPKTPPATRMPTKKASRSSLTAPTAASMARTGLGVDKSESKSSSSHVPKKREPTKPISLPSHLTAPTAASRAKHDSASASSVTASASHPTGTSRPKPASSTRPTPRTSLAPAHRPESQTSHTGQRRSLAPADNSSFLERMMKPTAASASRVHDKPDVKSPPSKSKAAAPKPKTNGSVSKPKAAEAPVQSEIAAPAALPVEENNVNGADDTDAPAKSSQEPVGNETPLQDTNGGEATNAALEATPAGLAGEETIR